MTDARDSPLRYAAFRRFIAARGLSTAGSWMQTVAAGWYVFQLTGDAVQVGILAAVAKGPALLATPIGGWLSDRTDRRRLAVRLSAAQVIPSAVLALMALDGALEVWEIYVLVFLGALPAALVAPVLTEVTPSLVPEPLRRRAMADGAAVFNIARLAGPAIGGALVAAVGVATAFAVNAGSFLLVLVALLAMPPTPARTRPAGEAPPSVRAGLVVGWRSLLLRTLLASALVFFAVVGPLEQVMPAVAATTAAARPTSACCSRRSRPAACSATPSCGA